MSSIPYNYGKYIDDTVRLKDQGVVDAGKQVQSPASAGSRGLTKTTQFTKDRTQMQMGNSPIAESMVEIRSILNRIDGVNAPVQEDDRVEKAMKDMVPSKVTGYYEITEFWKEHTQMWGKDPETVKYEIADWMVDEMKPDNTPEREELTKRAWAIVDDALKNNKDDMTFDDMIDQLKSKGESAVREDAGEDEKVVDMLRNIKQHLDNHPNMSEHPSLVALDQLADDLESGDKPADYESTSADSGELSRLKELSGIEEDAELTDEQEKGLEAIAKKYKDREGGNGDELARGHIKALTSSGITTDGFDVEEMEAYAKKIGKDWPEWEDEIDDFLKQAPITSGMMDDMNKVLGPAWEQNEKLSAAAADVLDKSAGFVPMPEADEFNIEEDEDFEEVLGPLGFPEDETELFDAEYQGRKVPLNKPMRGDVKKFKVYVKDPKSGNVKKVNFGHGGTSAKRPTMRIRKSNPKARKSFRARHNCANPGPKTKARYWSCRKW